MSRTSRRSDQKMLERTQKPYAPTVAALDEPARLPFIGGLIGKAMTVAYKLAGKDRYDDYLIERVLGLPFVVTPSVFNPKVPRTGAFLASQIAPPLVNRDMDVLDMGTGSGVCAVFAARHARARRGGRHQRRRGSLCPHQRAAESSRPQDRRTARRSVCACAAERFDLVLFNPPFLRGAPRNDRDRAWRSSDVAERFAAGLGAHLKPGGCALVLLSSFRRRRPLSLRSSASSDFATAVLAERRFVNERLAIFRLTRNTRRRQA